MQNNATTWHFQKLAKHVLGLIARSEKKQEVAQQASSAVLFLRSILKHLTETLNAANLVSFVNLGTSQLDEMTGISSSKPKGHAYVEQTLRSLTHIGSTASMCDLQNLWSLVADIFIRSRGH